jgi:hypothetical protein
MSRRQIRIEEVLSFLGVEDEQFLAELRAEGMFVDDRLAPDQAEDLRVAKILVDELGVNVPGVEVALHLRRRMMALEKRARRMAELLDRNRPSEP